MNKWDERAQAEFVNELRLIADRWKKGEIKDWGRLRTIIHNLVHGNFIDYIADMQRIPSPDLIWEEAKGYRQAIPDCFPDSYKEFLQD